MDCIITRIVVTVFVCSSFVSEIKAFDSITPLTDLSVSATTGEKPQSKVWNYAGQWWAVLPNSSGTVLYRLDETSWTNILTLSSATSTHADTKVVGSIAHILLYSGVNSQLVSVEYVPATHTYQLWSGRPAAASITLDSAPETAAMDIDSNQRMWVAWNASNEIRIRWSDSPYTIWSSPIALASGVTTDDICAVKTFNGNIGVLWSNQNTQRFGFKFHAAGADPNIWSTDEVPASQSAQNIGLGMADDHMNIAAASDGTLYAAVKTSYDTSGYPKIAMLVRRSAGTWDDLYEVDQAGTRGIALLNELEGTITIVYTSSEGNNNIVYKQSALSPISFGSRQTLITGGINDATSTKENYTDSVVIVASSGSIAKGVLATVNLTDPALVGHWKMDEGSGSALVDISSYSNNASILGNPTWVTGVDGLAVNFNGTTDYALVPDSNSLDVTGQITIAAWIKPTQYATQDIIKKATNGSINGYELSLATTKTDATSQKVFFRINQVANGDNSRVNSATVYPTNGTWMHVAATYDGTTMRMYINGLPDGNSVTPLGGPAIFANNLSVSIGAQNDNTRWFKGSIDDARIYNRALSASEIGALAATLKTADLSITKTDGLTQANPNTPVVYTIVARNNGPDVANGAKVTDHFASAITNASWSTATTGGAVSALGSGTGDINDIVNLPSGSTITYTINATFSATATGTVTNTASITLPAGITDPNAANNSATDTTVMTSNLDPNMAAYYTMEEGSGTTLADMTTNANNGTLSGSPTWTAGVNGSALTLNGSSQYGLVPSSSSLNINNAITIMAWIKPEKKATQDVVKKAVMNTTDGYELSLSSGQQAFVRFNQKVLPADTYRVNATSLYPIDGSTWVHVAATYDGSIIRLYINGIQENSKNAVFTIASNSAPLGIGAQSTPDITRLFKGKIDEVRVYRRALTAGQIRPAVPNVVNLTHASALASIAAAGLVTGTLTNAYSNTIVMGNIISQALAAGTPVIIGTPVNIVVSLGRPTRTISGHVLDSGGLAISDVVMNGLPGNPSSDSSGFYTADVNVGWSGTVTPTKYASGFTPESIQYSNLAADQNDQDYAGRLLTYAISGVILDPANNAAEGVTVTADSNGGADVTDSDGFYELWVPYNWSGNVTPNKPEYNCIPINTPYSNVLADQLNQDYTAISIYDLDPDGIIGFGDLSIITENWLINGQGDFDNNEIVNLNDFARFTGKWLTGLY